MIRSKSEKYIVYLIYTFFLILAVITVYPFWHVVMYSISDPKQSMNGGLFILPKGFSVTAYKLLMESDGIFVAYKNTVIRTVVGTVINVVLTASLAYPLSLKRFVGRNIITLMIFFTMLFNGGMIPNYLLVKSIGLKDSLWALIIPGAISAWNMFFVKNYFQSLPSELEESASIDGASPVRTLVSIIMPVSIPVIAAIALFYSIAHWNSFMDAIIYINSQKNQVLPVFLNTMLKSSSLQQLAGIQNFDEVGNVTEESVKMATVVIAVLPMLLIYPFIQKYYVKGLMVGSVKG